MSSGDGDWAPDDKVAFHGKQSLRRWAEKPADDNSRRLWTTHMRAIPVTSGKEYTFAIYLKGDRPKMKAKLFIIDRHRKSSNHCDIELTTSWDRYLLTWKVPPDVSLVVVRFDLIRPGTMWADAAQFEEGETAHPYVPAE